MEFCGIEVQAGQWVGVEIPEDKCLVIRQACIVGSNVEVEEHVVVKAFDEDKEIELATLQPNMQPQQLVAKMFRKTLTFSHDYKNGSVYLIGNYLDKKRMIYDVDKEKETPNSLDDVDEEQETPNSLDDVDEEQETPNSLYHLDEIPDDFDDTKKNEKFVRDLDKFLKILDEEEDTSEEEELKNGGGCMLYNRMFETKTLLAITVGAVCVAASWVMMHPRK